RRRARSFALTWKFVWTAASRSAPCRSSRTARSSRRNPARNGRGRKRSGLWCSSRAAGSWCACSARTPRQFSSRRMDLTTWGSAGPCYVESGAEETAISKASAQFFLDWTRERMGRIKLDDAEQRREVLAPHRDAEKFWQERVAKANRE